MATGLILSALSRAGDSVAQQAGEYQRVQDQEAAALRQEGAEGRLAKIRADLQVDAANRAAEASERIKNAPTARAGEYIKAALAEEVPGAVTDLSGADPTSPYRDPTGSTTTGLTGNYATLKDRFSRIQDPALRATALEQLDRQLAADTATAKPVARDRDQAIAVAMERALAAGDVQAYNAAKALQAEKFIKVGEAETLLDPTGKVIYSGTSKTDRALELEDRKDARQERQLAAQERIAQNRIDAGEARADARVDAAEARQANKPLTPAVVKTVQEARENAVTMDRLTKEFDKDYASKGVFGIGADASLGAKAVLGTDKDAVNWWKNYRKQAELVERHSMFGASLTPGEQASWRSADISAGLDPAVIERNLKTRAELTKKMLENTKQDYIDAGYSDKRISLIADRAIKQLGGPSSDGTARPSLDDIFGK